MALLFALLAVSSAQLPEEDGILQLDDNNFFDALEAYERVLVNFYVPYCGHCKLLETQYTLAAKKLKEQGLAVRLAKYDVSVDNDAATAFGVKAYPTLKLFLDKKPVAVAEVYTADEIVEWLSHRTVPQLKDVSSLEALQEFLTLNPLSVVLFASKDAKERVIIEKIAKDVEGVSFALCGDVEARSHFQVADKAIVLFKDSIPKDFKGTPNLQELKLFIKRQRLAAVSEFSIEVLELAFEEKQPTMILFIEGKISEYFQEELVVYSTKTSLILTFADMSKNFNHRLAEYLGVLGLRKTIAVIVDGDRKFLLEDSITIESITEFDKKWQDGKLLPMVKSEQEPRNNIEKGIRVLVNTNFDEVVKDSNKDVLVLYCVPWCPHCKTLLTDYQKLAEHYADSTSVVIAKIDAVNNDIPDITQYPTIKLFPKQDKKGHVFSGRSDFAGLLNFVNGAGAISAHDEL